MQIVAHYGNARRIHDRFSLTRLIAGYRIKADERSWRRAAYGNQSNWPWEWLVAAGLSVAIVLTGLVQTRQHWGTVQSPRDGAEQAAALKKAQDKGLPQRLSSLTSALDESNAQRQGLQAKFDQAQSELKDKQSELESVQSELEAAKQAAALMNTQAAEFPKKIAGLTSALDESNAQRKGLQAKFDQAQSALKDKQSQLEAVQSALEAAKQTAALTNTQTAELPKKIEEANAQRRELQTKLDQAQSALNDKQSALEGVQSELEAAKHEADQAKAQAMDFAKSFASLNSALEDANAQLVMSYTKVGDVLMAQGNFAEALKSYRDGLAVADRLTKADPGNASWQRDLAISQGRVGVVLAKQGDAAHALDMLQQGRAVLARLAKQSPANAQLSKDVAAFDDNIAKLKQAGIAETGSIKPKQAAP
ncbi:MAG TPA: hypothetical protein VK451_06845 [Methyloceanibacter sp.]|nr:hypothetical protein [Methyloceanibacter sp.]